MLVLDALKKLVGADEAGKNRRQQALEEEKREREDLIAIEITQPPHVSISEDGSKINLFLTDKYGEQYELMFTRKMFESVMRKSVALFVDAKNCESDAAGSQIVHCIDTQAFCVVPIWNEQKLLVTFAADIGIDHTFAMPASEGPLFRQDMLLAEKICKKAKPPTRR